MISEQEQSGVATAASGEGISDWFVREAPGIVSGLESSQLIGPLTAETAWELINSGRAADAVTLVLRAIDES